jgi:glycosyltransferase involved in cell wall biosynthesis
MAVYNRDYTLVKRALDSVMAQDFKDFELIIVDDGSNVELGQDILGYVGQHEDQLRYLRHKNMGQALSLNRGILNSTGQYIGFIDGDDEYKPNHISACLASIGEYDLITATMEHIAACGEDLFIPGGNDPNSDVFIDDFVAFGTLFGKREVFESLPFRKAYSSDADFYQRASGRYLTAKFDLRTYKYYMGLPDSMTVKKKKLRQEYLSSQQQNS